MQAEGSTEIVKKISKSVVEAIPIADRDVYRWDTSIKGFGVKVTPAGRRVYIFVYRMPGSRKKERVTIGAHGEAWTADQARDEAKKLLGDVARRISPRERIRLVDEKRQQAITMAELCERYFIEGIATKKPSTVSVDRGRVRRHILPLLGKRTVADITVADVRRFMTDVANGKTVADERTGTRGRAIVSGGKGTATRTVGLLGGIFSFAVQEGIRPDNPARGVKRYADQKCQRFLSDAEFARLGDILRVVESEGENSVVIAALRALVFTGCRRSEILKLRWAEVDIGRSVLRLADSKTGAKIVVLGAPAVLLLSALPRVVGNPYVFPGDKAGGHLVGLPKV